MFRQEEILVDGLGVGDVGNIVLRDRQNLAQNGIIIIVLTLEKYSGQLLAGPDIVSRGFVYVRESEDLLEEAHNIVANAVEDCLDRRVSDWGRLKNIIKDSLSEFFMEAHEAQSYDPSNYYGSISPFDIQQEERQAMSRRTREINRITTAIITIFH